jgi:fructokinase
MPVLTSRSAHKRIRKSAPISVGAGFMALDWLLVGKDPVRFTKRYAGGSFGNVMAILAYLGWRSFPVARLGTDSYAASLIDDLRDFDVQTDFIQRAGKGATPVIVVRVVEAPDGTPRSRFEWRHPTSGDRLPSHRPYPRFLAQKIAENLPAANVFYFDRAEPGSLWLATEMRRKGALVFFEPSSYKNEKIFTACMAVSDIVKYSAQRIAEPPRNPDCPSPRLEIQTLGENGLRFRMKDGEHRPGPWRTLAAYPTSQFKDATGCGDWCSAGLIHNLEGISRAGFARLGEARILEGLRFGQALAAVNCQYEGARGPMYELNSVEVFALAKKNLTT